MGYLRQIPHAGTNAPVTLSLCWLMERRRNARQDVVMIARKNWVTKGTLYVDRLSSFTLSVCHELLALTQDLRYLR